MKADMTKQANPDHPIHEFLSARWSPYGFINEPIARETIRALFEAARWAPSSYNEQPWRYIVATQEQPEAFAKLLSCLAEPNQAWAKNAPILALGIVSYRFERNGKPNRAAVHDLGLAAANIGFEATARGLYVHHMTGIEPDKARQTYAIPDDYEAYTALAVGHRADPDDIPENMAKRDTTPRARKPLGEFVFSERFGEAAEL